MIKRIFLFLATNLAVIAVLSITLHVLGVDSLLQERGTGLDMNALLIFASVLGFGGAFISLAISKWVAKRSTGAVVIESPSNETERWLVDTVRRQARQAGIGMPEVAVYESGDINAFATGMNKNKALVAVSTGLLNKMNRNEVEAVLGHEVSHVANGDMVTLTLIQGVVNTFVIVLSRVVGMIVDNALRGDREEETGPGVGYFVTSIIAQIVLGILASIIVMWFSRWREFRADAGGARLASRDNMIGALEALKRAHEPPQLPQQMAAFGINGGIAGGFKKLFMSHPPLEERIAALQSGSR